MREGDLRVSNETAGKKKKDMPYVGQGVVQGGLEFIGEGKHCEAEDRRCTDSTEGR